MYEGIKINKLKTLKIALPCLVIIGVCLSVLGYSDDNEQIRNVIEKYYHKGAACEYIESWNSQTSYIA